MVTGKAEKIECIYTYNFIIFGLRDSGDVESIRYVKVQRVVL
jgi:hypothetical protein